MAEPTTEQERIAAANRIARRIPGIWGSAKRGAIVGVIAAGLALGYKENVVNSYLHSKSAQEEVARVLVQERDSRSIAQKLFRKGQKPAQIPVGKQWRTVRDSNNHLVSIGKDRILGGAPDYLSLKPTIPLTKQAIPVGAAGAVAGAAVGVALGVRKRKRLEKLQAAILDGRVSPSQLVRARERAKVWKQNTAAFGRKTVTKLKSLRRK
ncbi:MAG: hypothetical protein WCW44_02530 [archaeon]|jgi:hypothetical protein